MSNRLVEYRIVKAFGGGYSPQVKINDGCWRYIKTSYDCPYSEHLWNECFLTKWGALRYIKKMKRNGDRPLYYAWRDKDREVEK